jgi:hypothetical protein
MDPFMCNNWLYQTRLKTRPIYYKISFVTNYARLSQMNYNEQWHKFVWNCVHKTWFKYDRDKLWLVYTQIVPVIFKPPCSLKYWVFKTNSSRSVQPIFLLVAKLTSEIRPKVFLEKFLCLQSYYFQFPAGCSAILRVTIIKISLIFWIPAQSDVLTHSRVRVCKKEQGLLTLSEA